MKRIIKWIDSVFWWRFYYRKTTLTAKEANKGRCLMCQAGIRVNYKDRTQPVCTEHSCPCKWNERLIIKNELYHQVKHIGLTK